MFNNILNNYFTNIFSFPFLQLLQIIERANVFFKNVCILGFLNFLYLPKITQYIFFICLVTENILVLFYHSSHNF